MYLHYKINKDITKKLFLWLMISQEDRGGTLCYDCFPLVVVYCGKHKNDF